MKVLFLSNLFPDTLEPYRGLDNATLLHYLKKDCDIRVMSPRPALPFRPSAEKICRKEDEAFRPIFLKTFYVPKIGSFFNHHLFANAIREPLLNLRNEFRFDVILVSWTFPDTAAVAKLLPEIKVPFVGIVQGSDAHAYLKMVFRRKVIVPALNQSSSVITRSAKLAHLLEEAGVSKEKLHPVYNGVDLDLFHPGDRKAAKAGLGLPSDLPMLLFVGNFLPVKNPLLLVRSHAELCRKFPEHQCRLVMVGGGPLEQDIRRTADEAGFGQNIILAGRKNATQVAQHMKAADLLCMASENEGVPNVILEAFASGLRVMATAVGGIPEVICHDFLGKLVKRGDMQSMTAGLAELLSIPAQTQRIRNHASQFSWEKTATGYLKLLKKAAKI